MELIGKLYGAEFLCQHKSLYPYGRDRRRQLHIPERRVVKGVIADFFEAFVKHYFCESFTRVEGILFNASQRAREGQLLNIVIHICRVIRDLLHFSRHRVLRVLLFARIPDQFLHIFGEQNAVLCRIHAVVLTGLDLFEEIETVKELPVDMLDRIRNDHLLSPVPLSADQIPA